MSRFLTEKRAALVPYTPGEQPRERRYIKLNTNESPFPPSPLAQERAAEAASRLQLYPDPTMAALHRAMADTLGVAENEVLATNGSDEILNFAFMAFCDEARPALFPDITYGFYEVFADLHGVPYVKAPLREDFTVDIAPYLQNRYTIFLANPNAPTGIALSRADIEKILVANPDCIVVVDEAYVDFGAESCVSLIKKYDNLLVTQTFSKSRSMAGARLGFGIACPALIDDLNRIKYATNPYNINMMTAAAGLGTLADAAYTEENCKAIAENRERLMADLLALGFTLTPSRTNFVFAAHPRVSGEQMYTRLREKGILVRHFTSPRISEYNRITVGTADEMQALVTAVGEILEECL